jgi:hypothetical protein
MNHVLSGFLALALFSGTGWALTSLVPTLRKLPAAPRWGYGYLLGVAWTCIALYALSHGLGFPLRLPAILAVAAIPALAAVFSRSTGSARVDSRPQRPGPRLVFGLAVAFAVLVSIALLADAVASPESDWDGRMTWTMQARWIWAAGTVDPPVLLERKWFVSHPQYPALMPVAQVVAMEIHGRADDDRVARPLYAAFFPALLSILYDACRRWLGRRTAAWVLLIAANVPLLSFVGEAGARSSYSDLPLACFYGAGLILLIFRPRLPEGLAAGLLLAAAALTKNEGLPLCLAALGLGAWVACSVLLRSRHRPWVRAVAPVAAAALLAIAAIGLLHSWRSHIPNRQDEMYLARFGIRQLAADFLPHARVAAPLAAGRMLERDQWGLFWPLALTLAALGARGLRRAPGLRLALAAAAPLAVGLLAYTFHPDPAYMVGVTWNRMLLHAAVPLFLLLGACLRSSLPFRRRQHLS